MKKDQDNVPKIRNDGSVNFCDSKTFRQNILSNLPIKPLVSKGVPTTSSPQDISKAVNSFIYELNKVSNGCFHLVRIFQVKSTATPTQKVLECNMHLYSQVKNYSILVNAVLYINSNDVVNIHSADLVSPIVEIDRYSRDNSELLEYAEMEDDMDKIAQKINNTTITKPKEILTFEKLIYNDDTYDGFSPLYYSQVDDEYTLNQ